MFYYDCDEVLAKAEPVHRDKAGCSGKLGELPEIRNPPVPLGDLLPSWLPEERKKGDNNQQEKNCVQISQGGADLETLVTSVWRKNAISGDLQAGL